MGSSTDNMYHVSCEVSFHYAVLHGNIETSAVHKVLAISLANAFQMDVYTQSEWFDMSVCGATDWIQTSRDFSLLCAVPLPLALYINMVWACSFCLDNWLPLLIILVLML